MRRRGFTLLELICVLVIVVIVAAALYPMLFGQQRGSKRCMCQSNLRQIALGIKQYAQDYNEKFPPAILDGNTYGWADTVQPYIRNEQVFQCPNEPSSATPPTFPGYTDYFYNSNLAGRAELVTDTVEVPIAQGRYPQQRYALLEVSPETGRYRQIRRHFHHVSHHLLGDTSHGRGDHNRLIRQHYGVHRMLLHAWRIEVQHPTTGDRLRLEAPLDAAWQRLLGAFGWLEALPARPA